MQTVRFNFKSVENENIPCGKIVAGYLYDRFQMKKKKSANRLFLRNSFAVLINRDRRSFVFESHQVFIVLRFGKRPYFILFFL